MSNIWKNAQVKITRVSGFDKSFHSLSTPKVGTITPLLFDEIIPASKTKVDCALAVNLPPLAFDTFMRVSFDLEAVFVPTRLLVENYQYYFADEAINFLGGSSGKVYMPCLNFLNSKEKNSGGSDVYNSTQQAEIERIHHKLCDVGTLADYLGFRQQMSWFDVVWSNSTYEKTISALPFLAYHRAWSDLYRNQKIQRPAFAPLPSNSYPTQTMGRRLAASPFITFDQNIYMIRQDTTVTGNNNIYNLADGVSIFDLRQRNWDFDPYTTAYTTPNITSPSAITVDTSGSSTNVTIPQIRIANKSQEFRDRNALVGPNFVDQLNLRYGANLSNSIAQRAICVGSASLPIYTSSVLQQAMDQAQSVGTNNPFSSVGAKYGQAYADAQNFLCNFTAEEPGYLFIMGTLTPSACYATGVARHFLRYIGDGSITDMANGLLEQVGPESIWSEEFMLTDNSSLSPGIPTTPHGDLFGYQDRYYSYKSRVDECHGLFRAGESLGSAVAQRVLYAGQLSSQFLQIPTTALDNVTAVTADMSNYGCMVDAYFRYYQTLPLHDFILPTITDPAYEHGKPVHFKRGGYEIR